MGLINTTLRLLLPEAHPSRTLASRMNRTHTHTCTRDTHPRTRAFISITQLSPPRCPLTCLVLTETGDHHPRAPCRECRGSLQHHAAPAAARGPSRSLARAVDCPQGVRVFLSVFFFLFYFFSVCCLMWKSSLFLKAPPRVSQCESCQGFSHQKKRMLRRHSARGRTHRF